MFIAYVNEKKTHFDMKLLMFEYFVIQHTFIYVLCYSDIILGKMLKKLEEQYDLI